MGRHIWAESAGAQWLARRSESGKSRGRDGVECVSSAYDGALLLLPVHLLVRQRRVPSFVKLSAATLLISELHTGFYYREGIWRPLDWGIAQPAA